MSGYRDVIAWQRAMQLTKECYVVSRRFPQSEAFGLTQQLRRAAVSVPANIAEGRGRWLRKQYAQFLVIARGSLNEVKTLLDLAVLLEFATGDETAHARAAAAETGRVLAGLQKSLSRGSCSLLLLPRRDGRRRDPELCFLHERVVLARER